MAEQLRNIVKRLSQVIGLVTRHIVSQCPIPRRVRRDVDNTESCSQIFSGAIAMISSTPLRCLIPRCEFSPSSLSVMALQRDSLNIVLDCRAECVSDGEIKPTVHDAKAVRWADHCIRILRKKISFDDLNVRKFPERLGPCVAEDRGRDGP